MKLHWIFWICAIALFSFGWLQRDDADYRPGNPVVPWMLLYGTGGLCCVLAALRRLPAWLATGMIGAALAFLALSMPGAWFMVTGDHEIGMAEAMEWNAMTSLAEHSHVEEFREAGGALIVLALVVCGRLWGTVRGRQE